MHQRTMAVDRQTKTAGDEPAVIWKHQEGNEQAKYITSALPVFIIGGARWA